MITSILSFMAANWFQSLVLMWLAYALAHYILFTVRRMVRALVVLVRGWPPAHLDADGDWKP